MIENPVVEAPPVATAPAPAPAPVKKPRPLTAVREPAPRPPSVAAAPVPVPDAAPVHATVTTLSRGKGVPPETREVLKRIRALLEERKASASVTALEVQRIGLEGESRLCIEFRSAADAQSALAEMRRLATGSDLLEIAETPCPYRKEPTP
ncbi:hypothetical protein DT603_10940 [Pseudoxanthomonas gei]|uniref:Uncharacterized protein n=1 Tax=Pseudoxanthomonas gei TaxID=1383030 RepID=A0ABX0ACR1_9GAMM|nr:hypothetical protein [Pseudoxanthomonas gei]